jgi:cobalamin-dependent methionine synthase I
MQRIEMNVATGKQTIVHFTPEEEAEWKIKLLASQAEQVELAKTDYQRQRSLEYPAIADYLDGIVKGDTAQVQTYIDACLAVKAKYPKPE